MRLLETVAHAKQESGEISSLRRGLPHFCTSCGKSMPFPIKERRNASADKNEKPMKVRFTPSLDRTFSPAISESPWPVKRR
jgi:hypothetical protein